MPRAADEPVRLTRIYTRGGDAGETSLGDGSRVSKLDPLVQAFGAVDELNSLLGWARVVAPDPRLERIQNELFDLGADLATPETEKPLPYEPLRILDAQVERLEREIDRLNEALSPLRSFVLPGGSPAAAALHLARTVCRRAERLVVALAEKPQEKVSPAVIKYLNRLSDFLFVASRFVNDRGGGDVLWVPGKTRSES